MTENILHSTTQKFLDIFDITNNMVILKDGTCSLIIQVDAMNFGLLAEEEQDSIMYSYAGLLNSLNYPIQIIIHSQTKDVTSYLQILKDQEDQSTSRTQQQRIRRYREFVGNLIRERNVLDKKFYVALSAAPIELGILPAQSIMPGQSNTSAINPEQRTAVIEKARNLLEPKRDHLLAQFGRIGLFARQLATQEIIQFFYVSYNPEAAEGQQISDTSNYTTPMVTAGVEGATMNDAQNPTMNQPVPVATAAATAIQEQEATLPGTLPTPVPEPASIPPQLSPDFPVTPPSEITLPQESTSFPAQTATTQGYTPTQMPATPTPVDDAQTQPEVAVQPTESPAPATPDPLASPEPVAVTLAEPTASTEPIQPEPTNAIEKPTDTTVPSQTTTPTETATIEEAEPTVSEIPVAVPQSPIKSSPSTPKPAVVGPTLASTTGSSDLPKPTLPNMQQAAPSPISAVVPDAGAVMNTTSPDKAASLGSPIEPIFEIPTTTEPVQAATPTNDQKSGADLPPLPEI